MRDSLRTLAPQHLVTCHRRYLPCSLQPFFNAAIDVCFAEPLGRTDEYRDFANVIPEGDFQAFDVGYENR
jgi:hypothetical protein